MESRRLDSDPRIHPHHPEQPSLAGLPRIASAVDFVQRWEAEIFLSGLIKGERAHRILLEVVRRIAADAPPDKDAGFERLQELQQFLNAMDGPQGTLAIDPDTLDLLFDRAKKFIRTTAPWRGISKTRNGGLR